MNSTGCIERWRLPGHRSHLLRSSEAAVEANWKPLEAKLGALRCAGFMFMGRSNGINHYKLGLSRRYLFLDDVGQSYEADVRNEFREIPFVEAMSRVERPLKDFGDTLDPAY